MSDRTPRNPIDYQALCDALLDRSRTLVAQWLPDGQERNGRWYIGDFDGGAGESANVNLATGQWIDNGAPDQDVGGDLLSLYRRIMGHATMHDAAVDLLQQLGWDRPAPVRGGAAGPDAGVMPDRPVQQPGDLPQVRDIPARESKWRAVVPVPPHAPAPSFVWAYRDKGRGTWVELEAVASWEYRYKGVYYGHVARFERVSSKGVLVKDTLPRTWCTDTSDPDGSSRWHWKQWEAPRPLYVPAGCLAAADEQRAVVVVEGEKCAAAGHALLGDEFDWVCWPGGCKAWAQADWSWLVGRSVILWPDADAKREPLSRAEKLAGVLAESKPVLPLARQPGYQAMLHIGSVLQADHRCGVRMVVMGAPGSRADGWDVADAIAEGWDAAALRQYLQAAMAFQAPDDAARAKAAGGASTPSGARAGTAEAAAGGVAISWREHLIKSHTGTIKAVRENAVLALDGMASPDGGEWIGGAPEAAGCIAFNEFSNNVVKVADTPWGTRAGVWEEVDELEMGNWLTRTHWLPPMARGTLEEAVAMVAWRHRYHPVRREMEALRGTWDGVKRLGTWLERVCLEDDEHAADLQQYLSRVGTWLLMGICARVMQPGCKFDYMVIFEGPQGARKSTLANVLGGEHFADTGLVLGEKDSYQNLQGVLVYEWGELDSLSKADVRKVKQFISSQKDRFRASFDRRPKDYPRQVVFIGTTNEDHYLVDPTGNRRFWPVRVTRTIDIDWVREHRSQLFAEAMVYLDAGERFHPTAREQRELFEPQQGQRQVEDAVQAAILRHLYDENQRVTPTGDNGTLVNEVTVQDLLGRVGIPVEKQNHQLMRQATAALRHAGWERFRSSRGDRPWMFRRPSGAAGKVPATSTWFTAAGPAVAHGSSETGNDIPF